MKRKNVIITVLAVIVIITVTLTTAFAYFTTNTEASGGYPIHLGSSTEVYERSRTGQSMSESTATRAHSLFSSVQGHSGAVSITASTPETAHGATATTAGCTSMPF